MRYDEDRDTCFDMLTGMDVSPVEAVPDKANEESKIDVKFICEHGKVMTHMKLPDCKCDLGWSTRIEPNLVSRSPQFKKCNLPVHISLYFPNTLKVFYSQSEDNFFPYAFDPDYWVELMAYALRNLKYSVLTFFQPPEAEMVSFVLPR